MNVPFATVGDNSPPDDATLLRERLLSSASDLLVRRDTVLGSFGRCPEVVTDENVSGVADLVKIIMTCHKAAEANRVNEKEPFLASGRVVDAVYKGITEPLEKARKELDRRLTIYQRAVAEAERIRRDAEAAAAREEAEKQRRLAEAAASRVETQDDLEAAIAKQRLADQAEADAAKARDEALAKPAEMSRTRGDMGAVASLKTTWKVDIIDRNALDVKLLLPHFTEEALQKALNAAVRAGIREISGAKIYQESTTVVR